MSSDKKLDLVLSAVQKLTDRFDNLEKRFDNLEYQLNSYIKSEANIVESDIRQNIQRYFEEKYGIDRLQRYDDKLKKISKPHNNEPLTEFDGLFVLNIPGIPGTDVPRDRKFVLIEAKRHVTMSHVRTKLNQYESLKAAIEHAKNPPPGTAKKYLTTLKTHKFHEISDILLYIGGRVWDDDALDAVKERMHSSDIGYATVSNASYNIVDGRLASCARSSKAYGFARHLLPSAASTGGGKVGRRPRRRTAHDV